MSLTVIPVAAFRDNYIWLLCRDRLAAVVDPGDAAPVLAALQQRQLRLTAILLTHHHDDHCGGLEALLAAEVWAPGAARRVVFGPADESITGVTDPVAGGETCRVPGIDARFDVIAVPGHTRGHVAYYGDGRLFCGDTLFAGGCGRIFEGTPAQMADSLTRLAALPPETLVYCAHEYTEGNLRFAATVEPDNAALRQRIAIVAQQRAAWLPTVPSRLADELATNPFLRGGEADVCAAAGLPAGTAPAQVFAALRAWKDDFKG